VTAKFGLGVGFDPLSKVQNPTSLLNPYELMSDIIQSHLQKLFCNGLLYRLTAHGKKMHNKNSSLLGILNQAAQKFIFMLEKNYYKFGGTCPLRPPLDPPVFSTFPKGALAPPPSLPMPAGAHA